MLDSTAEKEGAHEDFCVPWCLHFACQLIEDQSKSVRAVDPVSVLNASLKRIGIDKSPKTLAAARKAAPAVYKAIAHSLQDLAH